MDTLVKTQIDIAEKLYHQAKEELCKPEEDVVPYSVCQSAYNAVVSYLSGVLINHNIPISEPIKVEELINSCRALNPKYNNLQLSPMYHPKATEDVWMNMNTALGYMAMAEKTRQMINLI
ncbi:MAG: hypothetical protein ACJA2C_002351 [Marinoscillum sp.]|jgi:hypothetical protein